MTPRPSGLVGRVVLVAALLTGCGLKDPAPQVPAAAGTGPPATTSAPPSTSTSPAPSPVPSPSPPLPSPSPVAPAAAPPRATATPSAPAAPSASPERPEELALPTHGSPPDRPAALWRGARLEADLQARCLWLVDEAGARHAALWPTGHRADLRRAQVSDEQGRVVWASGAARDISGGYSAVHVERLPPPCRTGERAWWVFLDE